MTEPRIGCWYSYCCEEDLYQVEDEEDLEALLADIEDGMMSPVGIWETREEALEALAIPVSTARELRPGSPWKVWDSE